METTKQAAVVPIHIGLTVSDVHRSIDFYVKGFGFEVMKAPNLVVGSNPFTGFSEMETHHAFLRNAHLILEMSQYVKPRMGEAVPTPLNNPGCVHISFAVPDVRSRYQELVAQGMPCLAPPSQSTRTGKWMLFVRDPDGVLVELIEGDSHPA